MRKEPWERMDDETPKAYQAFARYRDLGPIRSLEKLRTSYLDTAGNPLHRSIRQFSTWSARYDWAERSNAYDDHLERIRMRDEMEAMRKDRKATRDTHRTISKAMQKAVLHRLIPDATDKNSIIDPKEIRASDIPRWVETATNLERLVLEMPTENITINKSEDGILDGYADPKWLAEYTKILLDLGLIKAPGPEGSGETTCPTEEPVYPNSADP